MVLNIIIVYLVVINVITFIVWGIDKWKSVRHRWRISEKELLAFSAAGGFMGAIAGMTVWHHKTIKGKFLWKFWLIVFIRMLILSFIYYFIYR